MSDETPTPAVCTDAAAHDSADVDWLDADGYPTEAATARIEAWPGDDAAGCLAFVGSLWWMKDWGWRQDGDTYSVSTAGWSGNESLIAAMKRNDNFVWHQIWKQSRVGGHYLFYTGEYDAWLWPEERAETEAES